MITKTSRNSGMAAGGYGREEQSKRARRATSSHRGVRPIRRVDPSFLNRIMLKEDHRGANG